MMKRPRLSRPFCVSMLALAGLLVLSYFPLSRIRANAGATILPSAGKPLVNLKTPQSLKLTYAGPSDAVAALQAGTAIPTALAAADFDADGAMDVVAGYSGGSSSKPGGLLVLMRGNPDAFAPTDLTLYGKAAKGNVPPTFLSKATVFTVPESPDLIATGDFNRDGYKDVLVGTRGGDLYLLAGDGHGNLLAPQAVPLPGQVTALAVTVDGHVAVSTDGPNGPQLAMLAPGAEGLTAGAIYPLPARGDAMEWGSLGGGADLAVGAGANVVMFYNALATNAQTETVTVPFEVKGLTLGDFIWDRDGRTEISVLADDGSIHILQHGTLNTTPLTAAELPARRAAIRGHHAKPTVPPNPTALGAWTVAKQIPYTGSAPSGPVSHSGFNSPRLASASTHDLMVLDAGRSQLHILDTSGKTGSPSADVSFSGTPIAALALPGKIDGGRDIVVLAAGQAAPMTIPDTALTLNVNTTADIDSVNACTTTLTTPPTTLSLREAVCIANNNAPDTTTINVPAGTYSLTSLETGELQVGGASGYSLTINGTGTVSNTIIQQTDGHDRIFEEDFTFAGSNPLTIQNVTLSGGHCDTGTDCQFGGGAILAGGPDVGDNLTLTNVVVSSNSEPSSSDNGGAIDFETPGNLTITSTTFSSNTANGAGGAIEFVEGPNGSGNLSVTGSTFSSNSAVISGGGISATLETGVTFTISGSTFTGNSVTDGIGAGGGIFAETDGTVTVSNSRFHGNSAGGGGTGAAIEASTAGTLTNNWWGCNSGPGGSGCDTVLAAGGGTDTFDPWLVLSVSANPTQILPTIGTSTLTADLTHNSNGTGGFSVPNGPPVSFAGTLDSSVNPASTTLTSGQATSTYTAGATAGNDIGVTATVDNATASTTINILDSVTVTTNPSGLSITVDNVPNTAPQTFNWVVGSSHTIGTTSPQNISGGTEQVWSSWSDNGAISHLVAAPLSATTYIADFNAQYQLTTVASPGADGSVTPPPGGYYASGATIPVTATANSGFQFNNWTSTGGSFDSTTAASTNFHMPAAPATVTGNFIPATVAVTITTSPANLLVSADGGTAVAAPLVETWAVGSTHTIATTSPQAGAPGVQYVWSNWNDSGAISHTITVPSAAPQYLATFNTQYQLTTAANPSIGGTVSPTSGGYYTSGTVVPLTATANAGYSFTNWTGNVANSTSASTTITMTAPQSVTANFSLIIVAASTTTSVSSSNDPSFTVDPGSSVTFTATVSSTSTVNEGTVTFSDTANDFTCSGGNTVPVSNGTATCTTSFSTEGSRNVTATYSGTVNFQTSNGFVTQTVNNHTVVTGNQFCNQGAITVPSTAGAATPYPSNIFVTGLSGSVGAVTVQLNGISSSDIAQTDLLLVGPTGAAIVPFAAVGDGSTISDVNVTLDDTASSLIPGGSPLTSGTYKPTSITGSTTLVFPAPAPAITAANYAATDGAATLTSEFVGTAPNGTWALYAIDNAGNGAASIGGGWCVNITPATAALTVTKSVTSTGPYNAVGQSITYSFVAKNTGNVTLSSVGIADTQTAPAGALTSGPTCQSLSSPLGSCSGSTTSLVSGQSATFTASYTITQADLNNGSVNDSATASGTPPTGSPVASPISTATVTTTSAPALTVMKSVTSTGPYNAAGQSITYSFVAKNTGNVTLNSVGITDTQTAPAGALTSGPTCQSLSGPTGSCSGSTTSLVAGQSATFTASYTITQADLNNGSVNDSATASGTPPTGSPVTSTTSTATVTLTPTVVQITITTTPPLSWFRWMAARPRLLRWWRTGWPDRRIPSPPPRRKPAVRACSMSGVTGTTVARSRTESRCRLPAPPIPPRSTRNIS